MNQKILIILASILSFSYIYCTGSYKSYIILVIGSVLLYTYFYGDKNIIEPFHWNYRPTHYMPLGVNRYYRMDYVPPIILPPHYLSPSPYLFNTPTRYPSYYDTSFCSRNPRCYPCPGWKYIGPPNCI